MDCIVHGPKGKFGCFEGHQEGAKSPNLKRPCPPKLFCMHFISTSTCMIFLKPFHDSRFLPNYIPLTIMYTHYLILTYYMYLNNINWVMQLFSPGQVTGVMIRQLSLSSAHSTSRQKASGTTLKSFHNYSCKWLEIAPPVRSVEKKWELLSFLVMYYQSLRSWSLMIT